MAQIGVNTRIPNFCAAVHVAMFVLRLDFHRVNPIFDAGLLVSSVDSSGVAFAHRTQARSIFSSYHGETVGPRPKYADGSTTR